MTRCLALPIGSLLTLWTLLGCTDGAGPAVAATDSTSSTGSTTSGTSPIPGSDGADNTGGTDGTDGTDGTGDAGTTSDGATSTSAQTDEGGETETGGPGVVSGYALVHTEAGPSTASFYGLVGVAAHADGGRWMVTDFGTPRSVRVHHGTDHALLHTLQADLSAFGARINASGDADGDGDEDYLIGASGFDVPGRVLAFSTETGDELWRITGDTVGDRLGPAAFIGDVDADGRSDLAVGASSEGSAGRVSIVSGADRSVIDTIDGSVEFGDFGASVKATGDINADGVGDFLVTAPFDLSGAVYLYSGVDRSEIRRIGGEPDTQPLLHGFSAAVVGDANADGTPDIAVGCVQCSPGGLTESGYVAVYSGANGERLQRFDGAESGAGLGHGVVGIGDVDGDGADDLAIASSGSLITPAGYPGVVQVRSGQTGDLIWQADAIPGTTLGVGLAAGDLNGDGFVDLVVGGATDDGRGSVLIYQAQP